MIYMGRARAYTLFSFVGQGRAWTRNNGPGPGLDRNIRPDLPSSTDSMVRSTDMARGTTDGPACMARGSDGPTHVVRINYGSTGMARGTSGPTSLVRIYSNRTCSHRGYTELVYRQ